MLDLCNIFEVFNYAFNSLTLLANCPQCANEAINCNGITLSCEVE